MSYTPIGWENLPNTTTPINKTNLNKMDTQIKQNADNIETNTTNIATNTTDIADLDTRVVTNADNIANFNLTTFEEVTSITASSAGTVAGKIYIATNDDKSLAKIYGAFTCNMSNPGTGSNRYSFQTSLRPKEQFDIVCAGIAWRL